MCGEAFSKLSWHTPPAAFSFLFFCFLVWDCDCCFFPAIWDCDLLLPSKLQHRKGIGSRLPMHRLPPESQCDWCKRKEILKVAHVSCFTDSTNCSWVVRKSASLFTGASNKTALQLGENQLHCLLEHQTKLLFNCVKISSLFAGASNQSSNCSWMCENQLHSLWSKRPSSLVVKMLRLRTTLQVVIDSNHDLEMQDFGTLT